ncbi:cytochrome P450 [Gammaproteobacteria bacterium 45_16_T64]|nr:cytochrome P450 [Gammaproteobacteria bacterium 45_16_T64]
MSSSAELAAQLPKKTNSHVTHIPGNSGLPVIGSTYGFLTDFPGLTKKMVSQYGEVYRSNALFQNAISLVGPDGNEFILKDAERNFSSKRAWDTVLEKIFPNGLMLRDFENHKYHRKILQGAFKKAPMQGYVGQMNPAISAGINHWPVDAEFKFFDHIKTLLLDTGAEVFLGATLDEKEAKKINQAFIDAVDATLAVVRFPIPGNTWYRGMKGRKILENFIQALIPEKRQSSSGDFFSQICDAKDEDGNQLSDSDVVDHMIFLLFAAHDTTTSTLSSMIYLLAKNPEWQTAVREEMENIENDNITYDELSNLEKTGWVFKETLRMCPALPTIPRRAVRECEYKGYRIPKNATVSAHPLYTHFMPEYWTNPETFDPERWSPERAEYKKHFFQFAPFGGGAHKCLGLNFAEIQSKIFLFHFLRTYTVSVTPGYTMPVQTVPIAMPKDGLLVTIRRN